MSDTTTANDRREVNYTSIAEFRDDVERLAQADVVTVGNWSFGQILAHLARTIENSLDGFPFQFPWLMRKVATTFFKKKILREKMTSGFKLPNKAATMIPDATSTDEGLRLIRAAFDRLEQESPEAAHPVFGPLTSDEWKLLHLRHAELHMSFARPADA